MPVRHPDNDLKLEFKFFALQVAIQGILAAKFFLSVQNGILEMARHFVAIIPCHNIGTKILAYSQKWHLRKWHAIFWQEDEQTLSLDHLEFNKNREKSLSCTEYL